MHEKRCFACDKPMVKQPSIIDDIQQFFCYRCNVKEFWKNKEIIVRQPLERSRR